MRSNDIIENMIKVVHDANWFCYTNRCESTAALFADCWISSQLSNAQGDRHNPWYRYKRILTSGWTCPAAEKGPKV